MLKGMTDGSGDRPAAASLTQLRDGLVAHVMQISQVRNVRVVAALRDVRGSCSCRACRRPRPTATPS